MSYTCCQYGIARAVTPVGVGNPRHCTGQLPFCRVWAFLNSTLLPSSYAEPAILSDNKGAGLNRTMYGFILRMAVTVECYHAKQKVASDNLLTQTVSVVDVPSYFGGAY